MMAFKLPMYLIVGDQPVSWEYTEDGGSILLGWDFKKKEMTQAAASWDDVVGLQPGIPVEGSTHFSEGGDTVRVTKRKFNAAARKLKNAS
jgi:hypothetical protein